MTIRRRDLLKFASAAVLSGGLHPHYAEVVRTLSQMANDSVVTLAP